MLANFTYYLCCMRSLLTPEVVYSAVWLLTKLKSTCSVVTRIVTFTALFISVMEFVVFGMILNGTWRLYSVAIVLH